MEPIFGSDDIKKKMPLEHRKFEMIDRFIRTINEVFFKDPQLWDGVDGDKMKNDFDTSNKSLDQIQKSLQDYLETKKKYFPRFYFLSDEQLLEILSQSRDPTMVQKHVNKCFEAINLLQFDDKELVYGMISPENEIVPLSATIDVNDPDKKGHVEKWLLEIEIQMKATLRQISKESNTDLTERNLWVQKYPAMVVLAINMIRWTFNVEQSIKSLEHSPNSVFDLQEKLN